MSKSSWDVIVAFLTPRGKVVRGKRARDQLAKLTIGNVVIAGSRDSYETTPDPRVVLMVGREAPAKLLQQVKSSFSVRSSRQEWFHCRFKLRVRTGRLVFTEMRDKAEEYRLPVAGTKSFKSWTPEVYEESLRQAITDALQTSCMFKNEVFYHPS